MNPDKNPYQPEVNLPPPVAEQGKQEAQPSVPEKPMLKAERDSQAAELPQAGQMPPMSQTSPSLPAAPPPIPPPSQAAAISPSQHRASPPTADDVDLIEKEWVLRAKSIVEHTRDDPHQQNQEINKFKADYIKKRYNKEI